MKTTSSINPPILLKTILDILFIFLIVGLIAYLIFTPIILFSGSNFSIKISDIEIHKLTITVSILIILNLMLYTGFVYMIYRLRKLLGLFFTKKLFIPRQTGDLNLIGKLIVGLSLGKAILNFLVKFLLENDLDLSLKTGYLDSLWFSLAIGLFFIYLSKIFENARILKEENDLTI
ncbi:MAG: DUF2975 domain-containing protein [Gillisia sp.]